MEASPLTHDLLMALDPVEMAHAADLGPDPWQRKLLRSSAPRVLLNCSRQAGKSTMAATLAVHTALYEPASLVLLLSPSLRQSQELFKKALASYRAADGPVPSKTESALRLELENGSRIVSLPGKQDTVRGFSGVQLLVVDEAARVPGDLYFAVRPMLAVSGGRLLALSTPFGTRGWWYEAWRSDESWERYEVPATHVPRITQEFLEEERRAMGEWWFAQEYECQFLDAETQPFGREDIERAFEEEVEAWDL
ncbi:MAG: terminase family protein [Deltaproteobacteria bacterium]|nr:terminase family protein [Deltaproteobacteria bacterium]